MAGVANTPKARQVPAAPEVKVVPDAAPPAKVAPKAAPKAAPKVAVIEVSPAATPAHMRKRHWMLILSFFIFVILPAAGTGFYLYTYAVDQYASKVGFTVRNEESGSAFDFLGGLTNISGSSSSDTDILYKFIQGQELVQAIDRDLDLKGIYQKPRSDPVFRLKDNATIEDLIDYWARMVKIIYDPPTGLIEVEVRAFDPVDARNIANDIFTRSGDMINKLSDIARGDVTRYAKDELTLAVSRLKEARRKLTLFRNENQIIDPGADIQGQMGLLNSLQKKLADTLLEKDLLTDTARDNDPRVVLVDRKIAAISKRIAQERRKLGVSGGGNTGDFADLIGQFESLKVDLEFAEKAYVSALSAYDSAVAEARRQTRYLAPYVHPTLAESSQYPQRGILMAVVILALFGTWTILVLVYYSLRDRR